MCCFSLCWESSAEDCNYLSLNNNRELKNRTQDVILGLFLLKHILVFFGRYTKFVPEIDLIEKFFFVIVCGGLRLMGWNKYLAARVGDLGSAVQFYFLLWKSNYWKFIVHFLRGFWLNKSTWVTFFNRMWNWIVENLIETKEKMTQILS